MKKTQTKNGNQIHRFAEIIVDKRNIVFIAVAICIIFSLFSMGWVEVENDLTSFLPEKSDSKAGVDIMMDEFTLYGSAQIMVANVTLDTANEISKALQSMD